MLYPYAISRESVNGHRVWIAKSLHLKGCVAQGDTRLEAIKSWSPMKSHGLKLPECCISLSQINTHTIENSYSIYTLAVRWSFYAICSCVTKTRFSVFIYIDG